VITHNIAEALTLGNRVLVMRAPGQIADDISVPVDPTREQLDDLRARVLASMDSSDAVAAAAGDLDVGVSA
jgi:ABC-type nitrate/sulfonate/bicarbonate transport system ATPase subunit